MSELAEQIEKQNEGTERRSEQVQVREVSNGLSTEEIVEKLEERDTTNYGTKEEDLIDDTPDWNHPSSGPERKENPQTEQLQNAMAENMRHRAALEAQHNQINWQELREDDPGEYAAQRQHFIEADYQLRMQEQQLTSAYQQINSQDIQQQQRQMEEYVQNEQAKLLNAIPAWRDKNVRQKESQLVRKYLKKQGYLDSDIDNIVDHRAIKIVRDSMLTEQRARKNKVRVPRKPKQKEQGNYTAREKQTLKEYPGSIEAIALRLRKRYEVNGI
ncbi:MAG: hypothetical protein ABW176_13075 [Candidatus Thiodiazotropha endolucinida]